MEQQKASAAQTIEAVQKQMNEACAEAFQLSERLTEAKERIKAYQTVLNGVQLGESKANESAALQAEAETPDAVPE